MKPVQTGAGAHVPVIAGIAIPRKYSLYKTEKYNKAVLIRLIINIKYYFKYILYIRE
jgi:hypothetical protein